MVSRTLWSDSRRPEARSDHTILWILHSKMRDSYTYVQRCGVRGLILVYSI